MRERARVQPGRDEPGDVGHVHEQQRPDVVRDLRKPLEVDDPRVGATRRATITFGRTSRARRASWSSSIRSVSFRTP